MSRRQRHEMLTSAGATLVRATKHEIWKFPNGKIVVTGGTISDKRAIHQIRLHIRRACQ